MNYRFICAMGKTVISFTTFKQCLYNVVVLAEIFSRKGETTISKRGFHSSNVSNVKKRKLTIMCLSSRSFWKVNYQRTTQRERCHKLSESSTIIPLIQITDSYSVQLRWNRPQNIERELAQGRTETKTGSCSVCCSFSAALTWQDRIRVIVHYFPRGHNADTTAHDIRQIWDRITVKEYERENVAVIQNNRKSSICVQRKHNLTIWRCSSSYYLLYFQSASNLMPIADFYHLIELHIV